MLEQAEISQQFHDLLEMERQAERLYAELLGGVGDPAVRQQLDQLLRDKQRHIRLTERLLEIVENA